MRNIFRSFSSIADIRTFFSFACTKYLVGERRIKDIHLFTFSHFIFGNSFVLRTTLRLPTVLITNLLL